MPNTKCKIILGIASISVIIALFICMISIIASVHVINREATNKLLYLTQSKTYEIDRSLNQVEKAVEDLYQTITATIDFEKLEKDKSYAASYIKQLTPVIKNLSESTEGVIGGYFYFNPKYRTGNKVQAIWYAKPNLNFPLEKQEVEDASSFTPDNPYMDWYYNCINAKRAIWSAPYMDEITKIQALPYTKAIFINGNPVGVVGMDMAIEHIKKETLKTSLYDTESASLVNNKYQFIVSKDYSENDNLKNVEDGYFKFLIDAMNSNNKGVMEYKDYKDKNTDKIVSYTNLNNEFFLIFTVPKSEILRQGNSLKSFIMGITILGIVLAIIIILNLSIEEQKTD